MIITTIHPRRDTMYRQSVDIKKHVIGELEYIKKLLSEDYTTTITDEGKKTVVEIQKSISQCISQILEESGVNVV